MADALPASRPPLLLVEDEAPLAAALSENLSMEYDVEIAGTVEEARLLLSTQKFAAILSDHMLPGKAQGLDFLVEALERQPEAKRILMTGYLNPDLLGRSVSLAQLSACLIKPVDLARLKQELKQAISG